MPSPALPDGEIEVPAVSPVPAIRIAEGTAPLGKAQRRFNKLIETLKGQRREIDQWRVFRLHYQQQLADKYEPLSVRLRDKRIAMAKLLDRAMDGSALNRRERDEVEETLNSLLSELIAEAEEPELVELHDKYSDLSFEEQSRQRLEALRHIADREFGVDVDAYQGTESPEEFADWLKKQARERTDASPPPQERKSKARARDALKEQVAEGGTRAVRDVFRKLVSELHPDREADPAEHARKTELMQRVNQAYKAGDLLALLELQFSSVTVDPGVLAGLATEKLRHYIYVLETQSTRLRRELSDMVAPFERVVGGTTSRKITPDAVQRTLEADIREIKRVLKSVEFDLVRFRDVRVLKHSLGGRRR